MNSRLWTVLVSAKSCADESKKRKRKTADSKCRLDSSTAVWATSIETLQLHFCQISLTDSRCSQAYSVTSLQPAALYLTPLYVCSERVLLPLSNAAASCVRSRLFVCLPVLINGHAVNFESFDPNFWRAGTASEYIGQVRTLRSSGQGQGQQEQKARLTPN